jgi:glutathione synthase/RimK-type ligase-like ATP-grasp enzyme
MILVVSHAADDHAAGVLGAIERRNHPATLVDTAAFPAAASLTERFGGGEPSFELAFDGQRVDLRRCRAGWWRRPQPFTLHDGIDADVATWAYTECHEAVAGLWAALDLTWVNRPELDEVAHHKPFQLAVADEVGLEIPRTLITNDPEEARRFADELGAERVIYKTFLATEEHWRETRLLRAEELPLLDRVRLAPVIFQEFVPAEEDIRVTVVGDRLFATAIVPAPGDYQLDYRMNLAGASFVPTELAPEVADRIRALMKRLGLLYGAIDLRRRADGGCVFLEINPAGEWVFVEERSGQPITEAVADFLVHLDQESE